MQAKYQILFESLREIIKAGGKGLSDKQFSLMERWCIEWILRAEPTLPDAKEQVRTITACKDCFA